MKLSEIRIAAGYCGPPGAANGGYVAGVLASFMADGAAVRLQAPVPLEVPLSIHAGTDGGVELRHAATLIATAMPAPAELEVPSCLPFEAATDAAMRYRGLQDHPSPGCFVCGTARGDGLRIHAGPVVNGGHACVAAPWIPDAALEGTRGRVRPEFLWAALDCPGYFALVPDFRPMVLGTFEGRIERDVRVGEPCVVLGWRLGGERRKHHAGTALYGADGRCVARAVATWVELKVGAVEGA
jgi:hypothetical protein